jgi:signal transduction histidine kinase
MAGIETWPLRITGFGSLAFRDHALERHYTWSNSQKTIPQTQLLTFFAMLSAIGYLPVDRYYVSGHALEFIWNARVLYLLPTTFLWIVLGFLLKDCPLLFYRTIEVSGFPSLFVFPVMILLSDGGGMLYAGIAQTQLIIFLTLLLRLPMSYVVPMTLVSIAVYFLVLNSYDVATPDFLLALIPVASVAILTLIVAYRMDYDSRIAFLTQTTYNALVERERANEKDRLNWLQNLSRFLKHEFRNAMLGVSTSLDRMEQVKDTNLLPRYIGRARDSLDFMRRLLTQTADAATIAAALQLDSPEHLNLGELAQNRVLEYRAVFPDQSFRIHIEPGCYINGEPIRLTQLLDKLVGNAVEHSDHSSDIAIGVRRAEAHIELAVENRGDQLTGSIEELSGLFTTTKSSSKNLGLGLYVAKRIVDSHRGTLRSESLERPDGARFIATFPATDMKYP